MVLLTLDGLSYFLDDCFLDGCFLDGCVLLWASQNRSSYFVDFEQIKCNCQKFICTRCSWQSTRFFYIIICQNIFWPVRTHFHLCFLSARIYFHLYAFVWMLKNQKYWFFFVKNIVTWIIFDWIMNTKCFVNTNIYHHNSITAKSLVLANISAKNFQNTRTRVLVCHRLHGSGAERIKRKAFNISHLSRNEFKSHKR